MGTLPEEFKPFFWDTDFEKLDLKENASFIISRLYNKGGFPGIQSSFFHETALYEKKILGKII